MLKPASSSSSSARCWAVVAAALILSAAHVELVEGGKELHKIAISSLDLELSYE
jgi:hypothetical protein